MKMFADFNTTLPDLTVFFIHSSWPVMWGLVFLLAALVAIPILLAVAPGVRWIWPLLRGVPMIGPLLRWSHLAQFSRLMGLLLEQRVPLPDALRLSADGLRDSDLAYGCRRVADDVDGGRVLYESMAGAAAVSAQFDPDRRVGPAGARLGRRLPRGRRDVRGPRPLARLALGGRPAADHVHVDRLSRWGVCCCHVLAVDFLDHKTVVDKMNRPEILPVVAALAPILLGIAVLVVATVDLRAARLVARRSGQSAA